MIDDTKKRILARRAQLVMAALSAVACEPQARPVPCLETLVIPPGDAGTPYDSETPVANPIPPEPCLQPVAPPEDAGAAPDAGRPQPVPCLSPARNPPPRVCLKPVAPTVCLYLKK